MDLQLETTDQQELADHFERLGIDAAVRSVLHSRNYALLSQHALWIVNFDYFVNCEFSTGLTSSLSSLLPNAVPPMGATWSLGTPNARRPEHPRHLCESECHCAHAIFVDHPVESWWSPHTHTQASFNTMRYKGRDSASGIDRKLSIIRPGRMIDRCGPHT